MHDPLHQALIVKQVLVHLVGQLLRPFGHLAKRVSRHREDIFTIGRRRLVLLSLGVRAVAASFAPSADQFMPLIIEPLEASLLDLLKFVGRRLHLHDWPSAHWISWVILFAVIFVVLGSRLVLALSLVLLIFVAILCLKLLLVYWLMLISKVFSHLVVLHHAC